MKWKIIGLTILGSLLLFSLSSIYGEESISIQNLLSSSNISSFSLGETEATGQVLINVTNNELTDSEALYIELSLDRSELQCPSAATTVPVSIRIQGGIGYTLLSTHPTRISEWTNPATLVSINETLVGKVRGNFYGAHSGIYSATLNVSMINKSFLDDRTSTENLLWSGWKEHYSLSLPNGNLIQDPSSGLVLSEAMGHALLLAVQFNDQDFFDKIVNGLTYFKNSRGLYAWKINSDGTLISGSDNQASASESEMNILAALLQADKLVQNGKWQTTKAYRTLADTLESIVWQYEIFNLSGNYIFLPSDNKENQYWPLYYENGPSGSPKISFSPTYLNLGFIRIFGQYYPQHPWDNVRTTFLSLFGRILDNSVSLLQNDLGIHGKNPIPAWVYLKYNSATQQIDISNYFIGNTFVQYSNEWDSIRIPMYIGLDYFWNHDAQAQSALVRFLSLSTVTDPSTAYSGAIPGYPQGFNDVLAVGQYGVANKINGNETSFRTYLESSVNPPTKSLSSLSSYYYNQTFALYAYLILANRFSLVIH